MLLYEFFSAVVFTVVSSAALGYCYSWPNFNRRRQDVLECTWKSKYSRYRHVVPDLPAKSSSLDSSIARHGDHRRKSIARWENNIAFWGKQFKTIARWGEDYFKKNHLVRWQTLWRSPWRHKSMRMTTHCGQKNIKNFTREELWWKRRPIPHFTFSLDECFQGQ